MSNENAESIVEQLQQAHRISVAFYKRILPTLDLMADQLGCAFFTWDPLHTNRPGRSASQPSQSWAWDFVPLFASSHVYRRASGEKNTGPEDFCIRFDLYVEDSFAPDNRETKGQPDSITLPKGEAVLLAYLYRPRKAVEESFEVLWKEEGETDPVVGAWSRISENWDGIAFKWRLVEVIRDIQPVVKQLQSCIELDTPPSIERG